MHELGVSVYPDLRPLEEIVDYLKLASKYGVTRLFSSMFSVEGDKETLLAYFDRLIKEAHALNIRVSLDVNPECFERIGASPQNLKPFADLGVDIIRMDISYGAEGDAELLKNPYGIKIEFNASTITPDYIEGLVNLGVDLEMILACHNFYPQRYTGMKWNKFLATNEVCHKLGVRTAAFIASHAPNTHGVWDAVDGLPTVERFRMLPIDSQYRLLLASGNLDDVFIGNAYASEDEFKALQSVREASVLDENNETVKKIAAFLKLPKVQDAKLVKIEFEQDATKLEKDVILNFFPHMDIGDSSEWMWRSRLPRMFYQDQTFTPRKATCEMFAVGDVVMVNDNYKHYAGEVQIVLEPMVNDGQRNLVGHLPKDELEMLEVLKPLDIVKFIE